MARKLVTVIFAVALAAVGVTLTNSAAGARTPVHWLCSPSTTNDPCDIPGDTTDLHTGKVTHPSPVPDSQKQIDCFYLYPTVSDTIGLNSVPWAEPEVKSIAEFQAARFNRTCRIFAPLYRQVPLVGLPVTLAGYKPNMQLAYSDLLAAWKEYLRDDNKGRGFILIGHSQGTAMLRNLIRREIDPNPAVRSRLVGAFLMGGNVSTAPGKTTGGDFKNIPICTTKGQAGCVVAFSTNVTKPVASLFGNANVDILSYGWDLPFGPGHQVVCTDPGKLSGDYSPQSVTVPSKGFSPGIIQIMLGLTTFPNSLPTSSTTWTSSKTVATGYCDTKNGYTEYHINNRGPEHLNELPLFDTHLVDINFGLDRLVKIATLQEATYLQNH